jgi:hypothetical protein
MSKKDDSVLSSTNDEPKLQQAVATHDVQTIDFSWSAPIRHGDCKLSGLLNGTFNNGPTFRFRSDGTAELLAKFFSTDSGDVWVVDAFTLMDNHGVVLFTFPHFSSPATVTDNQVIDWIAELRFPAIFFSSIAQVNMRYRC